jgi:hypothetical protein
VRDPAELLQKCQAARAQAPDPAGQPRTCLAAEPGRDPAEPVRLCRELAPAPDPVAPVHAQVASALEPGSPGAWPADQRRLGLAWAAGQRMDQLDFTVAVGLTVGLKQIVEPQLRRGRVRVLP